MGDLVKRRSDLLLVKSQKRGKILRGAFFFNLAFLLLINFASDASARRTKKAKFKIPLVTIEVSVSRDSGNGSGKEFVVPLKDLSEDGKVHLNCRNFPLTFRIDDFFQNLEAKNSRRVDSFQFFDKPDMPYCVFYDNYKRIPLFTVHKIFEFDRGKHLHRGPFEEMPETSRSSDNKTAYLDNVKYSRGHLVPNGDFLNQKQRNMTFKYPNMAPQTPSFNGGIWSYLEEKIRKYAFNKRKQLLIVTGVGVEQSFTHFIFPNDKSYKVGVPDFFYKIIYDLSSKPVKYVAYKMENRIYETFKVRDLSNKDTKESFLNKIDEINRILKIVEFKLRNENDGKKELLEKFITSFSELSSIENDLKNQQEKDNFIKKFKATLDDCENLENGLSSDFETKDLLEKMNVNLRQLVQIETEFNSDREKEEFLEKSIVDLNELENLVHYSFHFNGELKNEKPKF